MRQLDTLFMALSFLFFKKFFWKSINLPAFHFWFHQAYCLGGTPRSGIAASTPSNCRQTSIEVLRCFPFQADIKGLALFG
jgi:hypothetical protein